MIDIIKFADHIRQCFNDQNSQVPQNIQQHPIIANKTNFVYEKVTIWLTLGSSRL